MTSPGSGPFGAVPRWTSYRCSSARGRRVKRSLVLPQFDLIDAPFAVAVDERQRDVHDSSGIDLLCSAVVFECLAIRRLLRIFDSRNVDAVEILRS